MKRFNLNATITLIILVFFTSCNTQEVNETTESAPKAPTMSIHEAVMTGNVNAIKKHIEAKTNLNDINEFGGTALHGTASLGKTEIAKLLLEAGADPNVKDLYGSTPLNVAITFGKEAVALLLIKSNADLTITTTDGSTALHNAAFFGRTAVVKALLEAGADQKIKNSYGATALTNVQMPFEQAKPIYDQISKDLGPLGFKLNYDKLQEERKVIAELLEGNIQ